MTTLRLWVKSIAVDDSIVAMGSSPHVVVVADSRGVGPTEITWRCPREKAPRIGDKVTVTVTVEPD